MNITLAEMKIKGLLGKALEYYSVPNGVWLYLLGFVLIAVAGYLLGSLNFGVIISKYKYGDDIRSHGSGNGETTNMMRTYGKAAAVATLAGDMLKAIVSVLLGYTVCGMYGAYLSGLCCIIGHAFPCFFGFKGGKGVAVTAAVILCTQPLVFLILLLLFVIIVAFTKYVSLASVLCMLMYPLLLTNVQKILGIGNQEGRNLNVVFAFAMMGIVIWLHRENIKRLYEHTEAKFSFRKSVKPAETVQNPEPEEEDPQEMPQASKTGGRKKSNKKKK